MKTEYQQTLREAGFEPTGMGWQRQVDFEVHNLSDAVEAGRVVWYAHKATVAHRRDAAGVLHRRATNSGYICCAPDPVTAMVYADIDGWKLTIEREYFNCIRVGFPNG